MVSPGLVFPHRTVAMAQEPLRAAALRARYVLATNLVNVHPKDRRIRFDDSIDETSEKKGKKHDYYLDERLTRDLGFVSASKAKEFFFPEFDPVAMAKVCVAMEKRKAEKLAAGEITPASGKPGKYAGMTEAEIEAQWEEKRDGAATGGSRMHKLYEEFFQNPEKGVDALDTPEGSGFLRFFAAHTELVVLRNEWLVYNEKHKLSGSIDLFCYNRRTGRFIIIDYKHSVHEDFYEEKSRDKGIHTVTDGWPKTTYNDYRMQQLLYRDMVTDPEEGYGFTPAEVDVMLVNFPLDKPGTYVEYPVEPLPADWKGLRLLDYLPFDRNSTIHLPPSLKYDLYWTEPVAYDDAEYKKAVLAGLPGSGTRYPRKEPPVFPPDTLWTASANKGRDLAEADPDWFFKEAFRAPTFIDSIKYEHALLQDPRRLRRLAGLPPTTNFGCWCWQPATGEGEEMTFPRPWDRDRKRCHADVLAKYHWALSTGYRKVLEKKDTMGPLDAFFA